MKAKVITCCHAMVLLFLVLVTPPLAFVYISRRIYHFGLSRYSYHQSQKQRALFDKMRKRYDSFFELRINVAYQFGVLLIALVVAFSLQVTDRFPILVEYRTVFLAFMLVLASTTSICSRFDRGIFWGKHGLFFLIPIIFVPLTIVCSELLVVWFHWWGQEIWSLVLVGLVFLSIVIIPPLREEFTEYISRVTYVLSGLLIPVALLYSKKFALESLDAFSGHLFSIMLVLACIAAISLFRQGHLLSRGREDDFESLTIFDLFFAFLIAMMIVVPWGYWIEKYGWILLIAGLILIGAVTVFLLEDVVRLTWIYLLTESEYMKLKKRQDVLEKKRKIGALIKLLKNEDSKVSERAANALAEIGNKKVITSLVKVLRNKNDDIRTKAALALSKMGDKGVVEPLIQALKDMDENVRKNTALALGNIRDKRAVEPLIQALKDMDGNVKENAAFALGKIGDKGAVEPLIQALKDMDGNVKENAALALGKIGDKGAVEPLIQALKDRYGNVRENAAFALGEIGDKRAVEPLIKYAQDAKGYALQSAIIDIAKLSLDRCVSFILSIRKSRHGVFVDDDYLAYLTEDIFLKALKLVPQKIKTEDLLTLAETKDYRRVEYHRGSRASADEAAFHGLSSVDLDDYSTQKEFVDFQHVRLYAQNELKKRGINAENSQKAKE